MNNNDFLPGLKRIFQSVGTLIKLSCRLPYVMALTIKHRRQQGALDAIEAERLDRIRNPLDYLGK